MERKLLEQILEKVNIVGDDVASVKKDVGVLKTDVNVLQKKVTKIELRMEQDALPRLQNIEACYTSTYRRYSDNVERFDQMEKDIELLKSIATEHSKQLQKIS